LPNSSLVEMNEQQYAAVTSEAKTIRCLAGAGSGKTRVLTGRISFLHNEKRVGTSNMLALTFTRLAAKEMKDRLSKLIGHEKAKKLFVGTFHSFCVKVLREWGSQIGIERNFTIYDEEDRLSLLQAIINDLNAKKVKTPDMLANMQAWDKMWPDDDLGRVAREYYYRLRQHNALDLDLLLHRTNDLLDIDQVRDYYRNIYRYVFVDEFQDTSSPQTSILTKLNPDSLFVVGDDFQSIYGWRGANPYTLIVFGPVSGFPEAETVKLETNYRSTKPIVDAANRLIAHNVNQTEKTLTTDRPGSSIIFNEYDTDLMEFTSIVAFIKGNNQAFSDYAVLARTNRQLLRLKEVLDEQNIPCQIVNAGGDIFKRPAIKGVLDFIAAASNPLDNITMKKAFNFPEPRATSMRMEMMELDALDSELSLFLIIQTFGEEYSSFIQAVKDMDAALDEVGHDADLTFVRAYEILGLDEYMKYKGLNNRLEDILEARRQIIHWQVAQLDLGGSTSYDAFLRWLRTKDIQERLLQEEENSVKLLTVHAAKGLEFPVVFIIGMNQGVFPSKKSEDFEEERRLFYVAITRAKDMLLISRAKERIVWGDHAEPTEPSVFLSEILI